MAGVSLMNAREALPVISRRRMSVAPIGSISCAARRASSSAVAASSNVPSMIAFFAPARTTSIEARSPRIIESAPSRMLLPAPVSPVMTFRPESKATSISSMSA